MGSGSLPNHFFLDLIYKIYCLIKKRLNPSKKINMSLKKKIENNPFAYLVTTIVAAVTITAAVVKYYDNQKIEIIEYKYNQELSSIKRGMGEDTTRLDVTRLIIPRESVNELIQSNSYFFSQDHFYALKSKLNDKWEYELTTELDFLLKLMRPKDIYSAMVVEAETLFRLIPVHLWRNKETYRIKENKESDKVIVSLFSHICVQRITHETFAKMMGTALTEKMETSISKLLDDDVEADSQITALEKFYRGDATGFFLAIDLKKALSSVSTIHQPILTSIQKKGNVVYVRTESILRGVVVNNVQYKEFYFIRELVLISTPSELFFVKTFVPTYDLRSKDFQWITRWFGYFRIVA